MSDLISQQTEQIKKLATTVSELTRVMENEPTGPPTSSPIVNTQSPPSVTLKPSAKRAAIVDIENKTKKAKKSPESSDDEDSESTLSGLMLNLIIHLISYIYINKKY